MNKGHLGFDIFTPSSEAADSHTIVWKYRSQIRETLRSPGELREKYERLKTHAAVTKLIGSNLVIAGTTSIGVTPEVAYFLVEWWAWRANEVGRDQADAELEAYLASPVTMTTATLFCFGLRVPQPIHIAYGIDILPVDQLPKNEMAHVHYLCGGANLFQMQPTAVMRRLIAHKIVDDGKVATTIFSESTHLSLFAKFLNLIPGIGVVPGSIIYDLPASRPLGIFTGQGGTYKPADVVCPAGQIGEPTPQQVEIVARRYLDFFKFPSRDRILLENAITRFCFARNHSSFDQKVLDLGIALEMLLLSHEASDRSQLSYTLSTRGAWLLGADSAERQLIFKRLKEIYGWRSQVAHTGSCRDLKRSVESHRRINDATELVARIFSVILERQRFPDWSALVFG